MWLQVTQSRSSLRYAERARLAAIAVGEAVVKRHLRRDKHLPGLRQDRRVGGQCGDGAPLKFGGFRVAHVKEAESRLRHTNCPRSFHGDCANLGYTTLHRRNFIDQPILLIRERRTLMATIEYYFEDAAAGDVLELGSRTVSEAEILAFARDFDPQPFHIDPEAAGQSIFGGIIASGWHTCALTMRLMVDGFLSRAASLGSPGVEQIRWLRPVRPGDTLTARLVVLNVRPSQSKPDRGAVQMRTEVTNQAGEVVMTMESTGLVGRRSAG